MVVKGFCDPDRFGFCASYNIIAVCEYFVHRNKFTML